MALQTLSPGHLVRILVEARVHTEPPALAQALGFPPIRGEVRGVVEPSLVVCSTPNG